MKRILFIMLIAVILVIYAFLCGCKRSIAVSDDGKKERIIEVKKIFAEKDIILSIER